MKPKRPAKPETRHGIATRLAAHFQVAPQTATQWFDAGCPVHYEDAVEWKLQRQAEAAIKAEKGRAPSRIEKALQQAKACEETVNWDAMSTDFRAMCDIVADFYLMGMTVNAINTRLGVKIPVVMRIIANHPDTKDKESQVASAAWKDVRRLAVDALRDKLADPTQVGKMKPAELNFVAGTAQDKIRDSEGGSQLTINIEHKINGLSYEELINSLPPKSDTIEGEFTITPAGTSNRSDAPSANEPIRLKKSVPTSAPFSITDQEIE
jgi:hypothetical protein